MKGLTHFISGLAVTSFFPVAVHAAGEGIPWYFVLGGAAALLPDTIDFKFLRFFYKHDREITPDATNPDPAAIAAAVAGAIDAATEQNLPIAVKLNTLPLPGNRWQPYRVRIDPLQRQVTATIGSVTGGLQAASSTAAEATAVADTRAEAYPAYMAETTVDILDGPVLEMQPQPDGRVRVDFIPWHRYYSHSLVVGLVLGCLSAIAWNLTAGLVVWMAHSAHVMADQLGFMGSNLWYPLSRRRTGGMYRLHAMNPAANATVVWVCLILIFWNLSRATGPELAYSLPPLLFFGAALPILGVRIALRLRS